MAVVLITGCSSGFGLAAAKAFAARGDDVVATMRNPERATAPGAVAEGLGEVPGVVLEQLDVVDPESRRRAVDRTLERFGHIDVLVNNAGISALGATEEMPDEVFRHQFETNFFGPFGLIKDVLPSMRARRSGRIVNITSIGGLMGSGFYAAYCATKHALDAISMGMDIELQQYGIRMVVVAPGGFNTSIVANRVTEAEQPESAYPRARQAIIEYEQRMVGKDDLTPVTDTLIEAAYTPDPPGRYLVGTGTAEMLIPVVAEGEKVHAILRARDAVD
jgi:NAD(P)-dependent dehydrogenase (short-subunit alcohol dehydrogenase family)